MPLLQPHGCCGSNGKSGGSDSPPSRTVFSQKESEEEKSKNPPSYQPKRDCANYGPPSACV
eukprot:2785682-Ditylum_brightwellii.AAC.1